MTGSTLAVHNSVVTMSSREIAELTGKRHGNVLRDIEKMLSELEISQLKFESTYFDEQGKERREYSLPYRECEILITGYDTRRRAAVIDRWTTLEVSKHKTFDASVALNDPEFLRGTLLTYTEKVIALEHQVEEMKPDVEALERIAKAEGSMCITNAAKHLQVQPKFLFKTLCQNHWIYKRAGGRCWLAYQDRIQSGLLEHKVTTVERSDGSEKVVEQVLVTPKGLTKLSKKLGISGVAA